MLKDFQLPLKNSWKYDNYWVMDEFKKTMFDPPEIKEKVDPIPRTIRRKPYLLVLEGPRKGQEFQISSEPFIIGRDRTCALQIEEPLISRRHASIYFKDGSFRLKDLGSTNGTFLNGAKIMDARLKDNDKIQMGNVVLQFFIGSLGF